MSQQDQLGVDALKLLAETWMVAILRALADGALRPAEIERGLADGGHSAVMLRLRHLLERELVSYEHRPGLPPRGGGVAIPPRTDYRLTKGGRMLLEVPAAAGRWERRWRPQAVPGASTGWGAIKLLADDHTREIMLLLAGGPLLTGDLDARVLDLGRSALRRRLRELLLAGLLERRRRERSPVYELTDGARELARVAMFAGRWESRWARREHAAPGADLDEPQWWDALLPPA